MSCTMSWVGPRAGAPYLWLATESPFVGVIVKDWCCIHSYFCTYRHTHIHTYIDTYIHTYMHTYIHTRSSGGSGGGERGAASLAQPGYMPTRAVAAAAVNGQLWRRQSAGPQEPPRGLGREGGDGAALAAAAGGGSGVWDRGLSPVRAIHPRQRGLARRPRHWRVARCP